MCYRCVYCTCYVHHVLPMCVLYMLCAPCVTDVCIVQAMCTLCNRCVHCLSYVNHVLPMCVLYMLCAPCVADVCIIKAMCTMCFRCVHCTDYVHHVLPMCAFYKLWVHALYKLCAPCFTDGALYKPCASCVTDVCNVQVMCTMCYRCVYCTSKSHVHPVPASFFTVANILQSTLIMKYTPCLMNACIVNLAMSAL
jgi:hypothetical protein